MKKLKYLLGGIVLVFILILLNSTQVNAFAYENYKAGDVNFDGKIDEKDVELVKLHIQAKTDEDKLSSIQQMLADVNYDYIVDEQDIEDFEKYIKGEITKFNSDDGKIGDICGNFYEYGNSGDKVIDIKDLGQMIKMIIHIVEPTEIQKMYADINLDGQFDIRDITLMKQYIVKLVTDEELPINNIILGNIDFLDDKVTTYDTLLMQQYLSGKKEFGLKEWLAADLNSDGEVNSYDLLMLMRATITNVSENNPTNSEYKYILDEELLKQMGATSEQIEDLKNLLNNINPGDIDLDGKITTYDVVLLQNYIVKAIELDTQAVLNADIDMDGKIEIYDALKLMDNIIGKFEMGEILPGDFNGDGAVTDSDDKYISEFLTKTNTLTFKQYMIADVNKDGIVDLKDKIYISKIIKGQEKNSIRKLSNSEISNYYKQYINIIMEHNLSNEQLQVLLKLD